MKIKQLYLTHFGKFQHFSLKPGPGLTILYGPNEQGKTTLMAFIRLILYGFTGRSQDISKNLRKKYQPWQGQAMQGYFEFEHQGTLYRLERKFAASNATDELTLWDLYKNEQVPLPRDTDPGMLFLGIGAEAFEKSIYISQAGTRIEGSGRQNEITQKLLNLVTTGEEDVSYQLVRKRLTEASEKLVSKSGRKGKLVENRQRMQRLKQMRTQAWQDETEKKALQQKIGQMKQNRSQLFQKKQILGQQLERERIKIEISHLKQVLEQQQALKTAEEKLEHLQTKIAQNKEQLHKTYVQIKNQLERTNERVTIKAEQVKKSNSQLIALQKERDILREQFETEQQLLYQTQSQYDSRREQLQKITTLYSQRLADTKQALSEIDKQFKTERSEWSENQENLKPGLFSQPDQPHLSNQPDRPHPSNPSNPAKLSGLLWLTAGFVIFLAALLTGVLIKPIFYTFLLLSIPAFVLAWLRIRKNTVLLKTIERLKEQEENEKKQTAAVLEQNYMYWQQEKDTQIQTASEEAAASQKKLIKVKANFDKISDLYQDIRVSTENLQQQVRSEQAALETEKQLASGLEGHYERLKQEIRQTNETSQLELKTQQETALAVRRRQERLGENLEQQNEDNIKEQINRLETKLKDGVAEMTQMPEASLRQELQDIETKLAQLGEQIIAEESAAREKYCARENVSQVEEAIEDLSLIINRQEHRWQAIQTAVETLDDAFNELQKSFGPLVNKKTAELFARLTNGKYSKVRIARDFSLAFEADTDGRLRQGEYLSGGTSDQVYLAMRLAIAELMAVDEAPLPLLLDDVLTQYDDQRAQNALETLKDYCADKERPVQVMLFTCHQRLADWARQNQEDVQLIIL